MQSGADFLVEGSSNIARKFKIPEVIIGLTIVAIGTSLPELIISASAAINGNNEISMSNVVGSNIANLFLVISLCAIFKPLHIKKQIRFIDQPFVVFCTVFLFYIANNDGMIAQNEGIALLLFSIMYIVYTIFIAKFGKGVNQYQSENEEEIKEEKNLFGDSKIIKLLKRQKSSFEIKFPTLYSFCIIAFGIILLKFGGDITVDSASNVALALGMSKKLVGLTIVAMGTSLPELITCIQATRRGETDLAIGNIIGSQIFNIVLVLGTSSAIHDISQVDGFMDDIIVLLIGNIFFAVAPFFNKRHRIGRLIGSILVFFYFSYISVQVAENLYINQI